MPTREDLFKVVTELQDGKQKSAGEIAIKLNMPKWKIVKILKRMEKLEFVVSAIEIRFSTGRPRKLYSITEKGINYFGITIA